MRTRPPKSKRPSWSVVPGLRNTVVDLPVRSGDAERLGRWLTRNPIPLNLNVSAGVPTLETMCPT